MENILREPSWFIAWKKSMDKTYVPNTDVAHLPEYRIEQIDKELELYTLKEAFETEGIRELVEGLLSSALLPNPVDEAAAHARSSISSGLVFYAQPKIDDTGIAIEQHAVIETTVSGHMGADLLIIIAKTGAHVRVVDKVIERDRGARFSRLCVVLTEEGSSVELANVVDVKGLSVDFQRYGLVGAMAQVRFLDEVASSSDCRIETASMLIGDGSRSVIDHALLADATGRFTIADRIDVRSKEAEGNISVAGAIAGSAHITYSGHTATKEGDIAVSARESARFLLLNDSAGVEATPAIDVLDRHTNVAHELSITHIKDEELFYAQTKGIPLPEARLLALEGFFSPRNLSKGFLGRLHKCLKAYE